MKLFIFVIFIFLIQYNTFSQKLILQQKKVSNSKLTAKKTISKTKKNKLVTLKGNYIITNYYIVDKKQIKKKEAQKLTNLTFSIDSNVIVGTPFLKKDFKVYETTKIEKNYFLFRLFNKSIETNFIELQPNFRLFKIEHNNIEAIGQMTNGIIAIPYKGGLMIAKPIK